MDVPNLNPLSVYKPTGNNSSILPSIERVSTPRHSEHGGHRHFHRLVTTTAHDFIRHEVYTIHLVSVARQIRFEFVGLEIPDLGSH